MREERVVFGTLEFFLIPEGENWIAFFPKQGIVSLVNQSWVNLALEVKGNQFRQIGKREKIFIRELERLGFSNSDIITCEHATTRGKEESNFSPYEITFCLSSMCNLSCIYCFVRGGESKEVLDWDCAKVALDFVFENAAKREMVPLVNFSGDGEPTITWNLLVKCVEYSRYLHKGRNTREPEFIMNTNGYVSPKKASWIASNFSSVCFSLDGYEGIQNTQRPTRGGSGSFNKVFETARFFHQKGFRFSLRPTITRESIKYLVDIVRFFDDNFPGTKVNLESMNEHGRALDNELETPLAQEFLNGFQAAQAYLEKKRSTTFIVYNGVGNLTQLRRHFCGISEPNFVLTPKGTVTSCFGYSWKDDLSRHFTYGYFDWTSKQFVFDFEEVRLLKKLTLENATSCQDCFAKLQCGGDCPAIRIEAGQKLGESLLNSFSSFKGRCFVNREILRNDLRRVLEINTSTERR